MIRPVVCKGCFALCILSWFLLIKSLMRRKKGLFFLMRNLLLISVQGK